VVDQIATKVLAANQPLHQIDVGLLELLKVNVAQQPKQGVDAVSFLRAAS
jgi:hypothetical protein